MPLFAIIAKDKPGHLEMRLATRDRHVAHLNSLGERLKVAGPRLGEDEKPDGSLVIIEVNSIDDARAFADADPYAQEGLFETVVVTRWNALLGEWSAAPDEEE